MAEDNKYPVKTSWGDPDPSFSTENDNGKDFAQDSAGFNDPPVTNKTDMDMNLGPNMFPRQTGHDTAEDILFT